MDDDTVAVAGDRGAYVPCDDVAGSDPAGDDADAIAGDGAGYVPDTETASVEDAEDDTAAIVGQGRAYVARPCCLCGALAGSSGLVHPSEGVPSGTHDEIQSSGGSLADSFGRAIPYNDDFAGPRAPLTVQLGVADSGQQWWHFTDYGSQVAPFKNTIELNGVDWVLTVKDGGGVTSAGLMNGGDETFEQWDFGWLLNDHSFDLAWDVRFSAHAATIFNLNQFSAGVASVAGGVDPRLFVAYRQRRSTDPALLFLGKSGPTALTITLPFSLASGTDYRIRWQLDTDQCLTRVKIWALAGSEPVAWDGETTYVNRPMPNSKLTLSMTATGNTVPRTLESLNVALTPTATARCQSYTVIEDDVTQLGARQYQLKNSYSPGTITAFIEHTGFALIKRQFGQIADNLIEDDPAAGIFSFAASITHAPAYNPTIGLGTVVSACYIVPPA